MSLRFIQLNLFFASLICLLVLVITAAPTILSGAPLSGYILIAHISISPIFVIVFLAYLFMSSPKQCVENSFCRYVLSLFYLLTIASTFTAIVIIPLTMLPLFSTEQLEWMLVMHQRCAIAMLCSTLIFVIMKNLTQNRFFEE